MAAFVVSRFQGPEGWPCQGEVILDLPAEVAARHTSDGLGEALGPGRCRLIAGSWSWPGLAAAIGRFDADIEIVGPTELRDAFARLARRFADAAGGGATTPPRPVRTNR